MKRIQLCIVFGCYIHRMNLAHYLHLKDMNLKTVQTEESYDNDENQW